jgi:predicted permease
VNGVFATGSFWDLVGVEPVIGRFFGPNEDRAGAERVVVIGHALWRSRFGGDRSAVGTTIDFGWGPYTVIGVTPAGFTGPYLAAVDLWLPVRSAGQVIRGERWLTDGRRYNWLRGLARLAPVATIELAEEVATALHRRGRSELIANGDYDANARIRATPLIAARGPDGSREARVSLWLAGVSAIVLLIACVNVANLLLARSLLRRRETAIRLAIGVPRGRLVADTMTEGLLLSLAGGAAALVVARWGGGLIRGTLLPNVEWTASGVDGMTLAFVLALALLGGLLATLIPAIESQRRDVADVLRATAGNISRSSQRTRMALTVAQAALSVILLVGAGLFVRSLDRVRSLDLGFELDNLYIAQPIEVADARSDTANTGIVVTASRARYATAAEQLARVPGVASAAYSIGVPFYTSWSVDLAVPGRDSIPVHPTGGPYITIVSRDYLPTMDVRVLRGRGFEAGDFTGAGLVAVVNNTMAGFVWPGQDPLGQCLRVELLEGPCTTVVGIVEDARRASIVEQPTPQFYVPLPHPVAASLDPEMMLVRTTASDGSLIRRIRDAMMAADPALRFVTVRPLESMAAVELRPWQLGATLFGIFGLVALAVAALGLYSVLSFDVAQRTREIGLRSALGATVGRLLVGLVGRGVRMTAIGLLIGLAVASLLAPFARDLLYDVSPRDPVTIAVVSAVLLFVAVIAGLLPAWRAASVDPRIALLEE